MPLFEFRLTCMDDVACKATQLVMSDFRNKNVKGDKSYDHIALKKFSNWEEAIKASKELEMKLGHKLVDVTIAAK